MGNKAELESDNNSLEGELAPVMVEAIDLSKEVVSGDSRLVILHQISLVVRAGEAVAIVGASGSGKSTLLGLLAGLDLPSSGQVKLAGADLTRLDEDGRAALRGRLVGFVFQSFQLLPALTALDNVMLPLELMARPHARRDATALLQRVGLGERLGHYPRTLSGGEQQRVALARAFATGPAILFADEPTGNLDAANGAAIIDLMFQLNAEQGTTLILVTHDEALAARCDRSLRLSGGKMLV